MRISDWSSDVCSSDRTLGNEVKLCFMHPVKAEEAVAEAYHVHGVRTFSLDSMDELAKIMRATNDATDLELCVRLRMSSEHSELSLASKFGAELGDTRELLMATRQAADALAICFHVGSQAMSPQASSDAIERVRAAICDAAVTETGRASCRERVCQCV